MESASKNTLSATSPVAAGRLLDELGAIGFNKMALDLAHRQATRIQHHDLVAEAGEVVALIQILHDVQGRAVA
jgi:hypothetical protein